MTDTLTNDELDVEFILWEAEDPFDLPCERYSIPCGNTALYKFVYVAYYETGYTPCLCGPLNFCLRCKDQILAQMDSNGGHLDPVFHCVECDGYAELKRIDPLRR